MLRRAAFLSTSIRLHVPTPTSLAKRLAATSGLLLLIVACASEPADRLDEIRAAQEAGNIRSSIEPLAEMIEDGDRRGEVLYRYGRALSVTGQPGRAVWALDSALEDPDWFVHASHQLAINANASGNYDLALEVLRRLADEREDDPAEDIPARILEMRVLLATRRMYDEAIDQIDSFLDEYPDNEEVIRLKAVALLGMGEPDEAYELIREAEIQFVDAAVSEDEAAEEGAEPEVTAETQSIAAANAIVDDEAAAAAENDDLESERGLDPEAAAEKAREAYWCTVRATFKREAGQIKEAVEIVDECLADHPSSVSLLNEAVQIYAKLGRHDRVTTVLRNAVEDAPQDRSLRKALVEHLRRVGLDDEAEQILDDALEAALTADPPKPIRAATIQVDRAGHLLETGQIDEGLAAYESAFELLGDQAAADLKFRYADALVLAKRYDDAIAAIEDNSIEVYPPMIRGRVAFERGDYATALEELDRVATFWPSNAPTRYYLARAAEGVGDLDRAIEEYRQAMRSDPFLHAARERLIRLHLAEGNVRDAQTIHRFNSPKKGIASPSIEMKILQIEIQTRLGNEPDLSIPPDSSMPIRKIQRLAVDALRRGLVLRSGREYAAKALGQLAAQANPSARDLFYRAQIEILLEDESSQGKALEVARAAEAELEGRPLVSLEVARAEIRNGVELKDAETRLEALLDANEDNADTLASLGELAFLRGATEEAIAYYDRAIADTPDHWISVSGRFEAANKLGRKDDAIKTLEEYLATQNPYDGRAVLMLSQHLPETDKARRIALAHRAIRFGAGPAGVEFLKELDPEEGARYHVERVVEAEAADTGGPTDSHTDSQTVGEADGNAG